MATDKNTDRLRFPRQLVLHLVEDETGASAPNIAVTLRLFATRKNDYDLGPPLSDDDGIIVIAEDWVGEGMEYEGKTFIMDYASTMEDCLPQVRIKILSNEEISNAMRAMRL